MKDFIKDFVKRDSTIGYSIILNLQTKMILILAMM